MLCCAAPEHRAPPHRAWFVEVDDQRAAHEADGHTQAALHATAVRARRLVSNLVRPQVDATQRRLNRRRQRGACKQEQEQAAAQVHARVSVLLLYHRMHAVHAAGLCARLPLLPALGCALLTPEALEPSVKQQVLAACERLPQQIVLRAHAHEAVDGPHVVVEVVAANQRSACAGRQQADQHVDARRLAGAIRAQQAKALAALNAQVQPAHRQLREDAAAAGIDSRRAERRTQVHMHVHAHSSVRAAACWLVRLLLRPRTFAGCPSRPG